MFYIADLEQCDKISTLKSIIPSDIWTASNLDEDYNPYIGTTIDLRCPQGTFLSLI